MTLVVAELKMPGDSAGTLAVMQLARRTDDRYRDVPEKLARRPPVG